MEISASFSAEFAGNSLSVPFRKTLLLHEIFQRPEEKMEIARMSRHWYDLHYLKNNTNTLCKLPYSQFIALISFLAILSRVQQILLFKHSGKMFNAVEA